MAMSLLKDYQGAIQSNGYDVYNKFTGMEGKTMLGCWAHARRKFVEAMKENERLASEALVYIGDLYHIETLVTGLSDQERMEMRRVKAYPQIRSFEDVIRRISEYENGRSDVTHLLPKNWKRNSNDCNQH